MADFNFIPARDYAEWPNPSISFFGSSGQYKDLGDVKYIMWEGWHVATKFGGRIEYNPKANGKLPKGFKSAISSLN